MAHTSTARVMGTAMRLLAGNCRSGITSVMLENKMKKNTVVRKGMNLRPSGPMVCITTEFSMKPTLDSATCWTPVGTRVARGRPAAQNRAMVTTVAPR